MFVCPRKVFTILKTDDVIAMNHELDKIEMFYEEIPKIYDILVSRDLRMSGIPVTECHGSNKSCFYTLSKLENGSRVHVLNEFVAVFNNGVLVNCHVRYAQ